MDAVDEIKRLYYNATKATIQDDLARAIELLKSLPSEEARERVAVYMDGLSQMRSEWSAAASLRRDTHASRGGANRPRPSRRSESSPSASSPPDGAARARSGRFPASSRRHR